VLHRWPALAVATVAAAVPVGVALANVQHFGPTTFMSGVNQYYCTDAEMYGGDCPAIHAAAYEGYSAIRAWSQTGNAILAETGNSNTTGAAVKASSELGTAVEARGKTAGMKVSSSEGTGVYASGKTQALQAYADAAGSWGVNAFGSAIGVSAEGATGVRGKSSTGLGGDFSGASAPIRLQPAATGGAPSTGVHKRGEMFVDAHGILYFCTADSSSTAPAGVWKKVVLQ
jgi:hypothetical protein